MKNEDIESFISENTDLTNSQIASALGVSYQKVTSVKGVIRKKKSPIHYKGQFGFTNVAKIIGVSYSTLYRWVVYDGMTVEQAAKRNLDNRGQAKTKPGSKKKSKREILTEAALRGAWG